MVKILQDIWILSESGIVVFHRHFNDKLDEELFGGLITALSSFSEAIANGGMSNFELSDRQFFLQKKNGFLFMVSNPKIGNEKRAMQELENVSKIFFNSYPDDLLKNWNGDTRLFSNFESKIKESLEDVITKTFQKTAW